MNLRYHKISVDGENYYRDCNNYLGKFGEHSFTKGYVPEYIFFF